MTPLPKTLFEPSLSIEVDKSNTLPRWKADKVFEFFQANPLFRWGDAQNDCEDRANAICLLLDKWNIPNYKGWAFSGTYLKRTTGNLVNLWNYHVAAALPVEENGTVKIYIIDPATSSTLVTLYNWAHAITADECSYFFVRDNKDYIFNQVQITNDNWYKQDRQNYKWTIQGLAGINGVTTRGKAQLVFNKKRIALTEESFKKLLLNNPF